MQTKLQKQAPTPQRRAAGGVRRLTTSRLLLFCALGLMSWDLCAVDFPLRWRWSNPAPHGNNIIGMAYSTNLHLGVQVTERGQIYTSDDLILWLHRESGTTNALRGVTFFGNRIVITGEGGKVLYADSVDELLSGTLNIPTTNWLEGVAASPNLLVAVGDSGFIYTSGTGTNWFKQTTSYLYWLTSVAWGSGGFVAVGDGGKILTSANGTNWTLRSSTTSKDLNRVWFANGRFTAVGAAGTLITSINGGTNWTSETTAVGATNELFAVANANGARVVAGDNEVHVHENGVWSDELAKSNGPPAWTYLSAIGRPDFFLLGGRTGMLAEGYKTNIWYAVDPPTTNDLQGVGVLGDLYLITGDQGKIFSSFDGTNWTAQTTPTNKMLSCVASFPGGLVATGDDGTILISPDGTNWTLRASGTTNWLYRVRYLSYLGGLLLAVGQNGIIMTSADALMWTPQNSGTSQWLHDVTRIEDTVVRGRQARHGVEQHQRHRLDRPRHCHAQIVVQRGHRYTATHHGRIGRHYSAQPGGAGLDADGNAQLRPNYEHESPHRAKPLPVRWKTGSAVHIGSPQ